VAKKLLESCIESILKMKFDNSKSFAVSDRPESMLGGAHGLGLYIPKKSYFLIRISELLKQIDDLSVARLLLKKTFDLLKHRLPDRKKADTLHFIATHQAGLGDEKALSRTIQAIEEVSKKIEYGPFFKTRALLDIAHAQVERRGVPSVLKDLNVIISDLSGLSLAEKNTIFQTALRITATIGARSSLNALLEKSFETIDSIPQSSNYFSEYLKVETLIGIADAQIKFPEDANQTMRQINKRIQYIETEQKRNVVYMGITMIQSKRGDVSPAKKAFLSISDQAFGKGYRGIAAPYLAEAMAQSGQFDDAYALLKKIPEADLPKQLITLVNIGKAKAQIGDISGAIQMAEETEHWIFFRFEIMEEVTSVPLSRKKMA